MAGELPAPDIGVGNPANAFRAIHDIAAEKLHTESDRAESGKTARLALLCQFQQKAGLPAGAETLLFTNRDIFYNFL